VLLKPKKKQIPRPEEGFVTTAVWFGTRGEACRYRLEAVALHFTPLPFLANFCRP